MWGILFYTFPRSYDELERKGGDEAVGRFCRSIYDDASSLSTSAEQYGAWDVVSNLVYSGTQAAIDAYVHQPMNDAILQSLNVKYALHYTMNGTLVFTLAEGGAPPPERFQYLGSTHRLMGASASLDARTAGMYALTPARNYTPSSDSDLKSMPAAAGTKELFLLAGRPLKFSNFSGPIVGVIVLVRVLTIDDVLEWSRHSQTCASLSLYQDSLNRNHAVESDMADLAQEVSRNNPSPIAITLKTPNWDHMGVISTRIIPAGSSFANRVCWSTTDRYASGQVLVDALDLWEANERFAAYALLDDSDGNPLILVRLDTPRDVVLLGRSATNFVYIVTGVICFAFGVVILGFIEFVVLRPISSLTRTLRDFAHADDITWEIAKVTSRDELGFLAATINRMLEIIFEAVNMLDAEKMKSEDLLYNMMPESIAKRIKDGETLIADAYPNATCMFVDIVGFTPLCSSVTPIALVNLLNTIFSAIDDLVEKHHLEKVKSIGDAVMIVSGVTSSPSTHAEDMVELALDILDMVEHLATPTRIGFRVGLSSGPVIAGVIGRTKYMFDVWGNTVNEASRMESHGLENCIHMTEATAVLINTKYPAWFRGIIQIKGKGQMRTWILPKRDPSRLGDARTSPPAPPSLSSKESITADSRHPPPLTPRQAQQANRSTSGESSGEGSGECSGVGPAPVPLAPTLSLGCPGAVTHDGGDCGQSAPGDGSDHHVSCCGSARERRPSVVTLDVTAESPGRGGAGVDVPRGGEVQGPGQGSEDDWSAQQRHRRPSRPFSRVHSLVHWLHVEDEEQANPPLNVHADASGDRSVERSASFGLANPIPQKQSISLDANLGQGRWPQQGCTKESRYARGESPSLPASSERPPARSRACSPESMRVRSNNSLDVPTVPPKGRSASQSRKSSRDGTPIELSGEYAAAVTGWLKRQWSASSRTKSSTTLKSEANLSPPGSFTGRR